MIITPYHHHTHNHHHHTPLLLSYSRVEEIVEHVRATILKGNFKLGCRKFQGNPNTYMFHEFKIMVNWDVGADSIKYSVGHQEIFISGCSLRKKITFLGFIIIHIRSP